MIQKWCNIFIGLLYLDTCFYRRNFPFFDKLHHHKCNQERHKLFDVGSAHFVHLSCFLYNVLHFYLLSNASICNSGRKNDISKPIFPDSFEASFYNAKSCSLKAIRIYALKLHDLFLLYNNSQEYVIVKFAKKIGDFKKFL